MSTPKLALAAVFLSFGVVACATSGGGEAPLSGVVAGALEPRGLDAVARVPLITTRDDGVADSQVVPVLFEGEQAWLALDTGAPFTFLFCGAGEDEPVEHAGTVRIAGEEWDLPGYGDDALGVEIFEGRPIVGVLGLDFFLDVPAVIDYPGGALIRHLDGELPESDADLPQLPLCGAEHGRALVDVVIDGAELRLMFDTGAHDTFWLGVEGSGDDDVSVVQTADGARWEVFVGTGSLALPGQELRSIPVMRALSIGYLEEELEQLGYDGLLGLTAFGWRRIVLDFEGGALRLGPVASEAP